jgi:hypothetical protein
MLSRENFDKLNENFLYKNEPKPYNRDKFWCRNWTFKVDKYSDGRAYMLDTYYGDWDSAIEVTDENLNDFEFVFDFREVKQLRDSEVDEYDRDSLFYVATDSGGYNCGGCYWTKKDIKKSKQLLIDKKKNEIESLKSKLKWAEQDLIRLQNS